MNGEPGYDFRGTIDVSCFSETELNALQQAIFTVELIKYPVVVMQRAIHTSIQHHSARDSITTGLHLYFEVPSDDTVKLLLNACTDTLVKRWDSPAGSMIRGDVLWQALRSKAELGLLRGWGRICWNGQGPDVLCKEQPEGCCPRFAGENTWNGTS